MLLREVDGDSHHRCIRRLCSLNPSLNLNIRLYNNNTLNNMDINIPKYHPNLFLVINNMPIRDSRYQSNILPEEPILLAISPSHSLLIDITRNHRVILTNQLNKDLENMDQGMVISKLATVISVKVY